MLGKQNNLAEVLPVQMEVDCQHLPVLSVWTLEI